MAYWRDLRHFLEELGRRGKLARWPTPIDKDTELMPLYRLQFQGLGESDWRAFLFEAVTDAKGRRYDMTVAPGCYGASEEIFAWGMGCDNVGQINEKWHHSVNHPIEPVIINSGPVQEEVHLGSEIQELGLDELPAPVEEPGFSGSIRTTTPWITRDPETGIRNMGCYSGHFRGPDRIQCGVNPVSQGILHHWPSARKRNEKSLPVAITVGITPNLVIAGCTKVPYGVDELAVAGAIAGEPVELVRCKTVPLEVPANAEIVIEGLISTEIREPYTAFGEYPGYMMGENWSTPIMKVTAVTHRRNAIFTPIVVGMSPGDANLIGRLCNEMMMYEALKYRSQLPIEEVYYHVMGGGMNFLTIRMKKGYPSEPWDILHTASGVNPACKVIIVVDEDINPKDLDMVVWALSFSMQPYEDTQVIRNRVARLDPSGALPSHQGDPQEAFPGRQGTSAILIDATRKKLYPPVGLPKREYMERALRLWEQSEMPKLKLHTPWHGYHLGRWSEDAEENAQLLVHGEYRKLGEKMAKRQTPVLDPKPW